MGRRVWNRTTKLERKIKRKRKDKKRKKGSLDCMRWRRDVTGGTSGDFERGGRGVRVGSHRPSSTQYCVRSWRMWHISPVFVCCFNQLTHVLDGNWICLEERKILLALPLPLVGVCVCVVCARVGQRNCLWVSVSVCGYLCMCRCVCVAAPEPTNS